MISVQEALEVVLQHSIKTSLESVPYIESIGRVLAEDLSADRDFPPFDRVMMDGIAISFDSFNTGQRTFEIEAIQAAGETQKVITSPDNCLEVMTGSTLPIGVDTVIRYEDLTIQNGKATIQVDTIKKGQNIHLKGKDRLKGDLLITQNNVISPAEIGIMASLGKSNVYVKKNPSVVAISTGDELVKVSETPLPHQIRRSNVQTIAALLKKYHIQPDLLHIDDNEDAIRLEIEKCLKKYDVLILSGGVSMGKFDFIPKVLSELGVKKCFHKVKQRPGKPFWFGVHPLGKVVFALPGNPVSTFMCSLKYVCPWIEKSLDINTSPAYAILQEDINFKPDLTYFLQVKIHISNTGQYIAYPVKGKGSGDLANLADADGFLELPPNSTHFKKGTAFPVYPYR